MSKIFWDCMINENNLDWETFCINLIKWNDSNKIFNIEMETLVTQVKRNEIYE